MAGTVAFIIDDIANSQTTANVVASVGASFTDAAADALTSGAKVLNHLYENSPKSVVQDMTEASLAAMQATYENGAEALIKMAASSVEKASEVRDLTRLSLQGALASGSSAIDQLVFSPVETIQSATNSVVAAAQAGYTSGSEAYETVKNTAFSTFQNLESTYAPLSKSKSALKFLQAQSMKSDDTLLFVIIAWIFLVVLFTFVAIRSIRNHKKSVLAKASNKEEEFFDANMKLEDILI